MNKSQMRFQEEYLSNDQNFVEEIVILVKIENIKDGWLYDDNTKMCMYACM